MSAKTISARTNALIRDYRNASGFTGQITVSEYILLREYAATHPYEFKDEDICKSKQGEQLQSPGSPTRKTQEVPQAAMYDAESESKKTSKKSDDDRSINTIQAETKNSFEILKSIKDDWN